MKPKAIAKALANAYVLPDKEDKPRPRRAFLIEGPPGVGKSAVVAQTAASLGIDFLDVRLLYHLPEDLRFPIVDQKKKVVDWVCSVFPTDPEWRGIVALEELPQCRPEIQAVAMQAVLDRAIGSTKLPDGLLFVALGNRQEDRSGARALNLALANRFIRIEYDVDLQEWLEWAHSYGIHEAILGLLQWKPELLHQFRPEENPRAFPSPRSWMLASDILEFMAGEPLTQTQEILGGCVGASAAAQLVGFMEVRDGLERRFPLARILAEPDTLEIPGLTDSSVCWALASLLAERCRSKERQVVQACSTYAVRMPKAFACFALRSLISAGGLQNVLSAKGVGEFIKANQAVIFAKEV